MEFLNKHFKKHITSVSSVELVGALCLNRTDSGFGWSVSAESYRFRRTHISIFMKTVQRILMSILTRRSIPILTNKKTKNSLHGYCSSSSFSDPVNRSSLSSCIPQHSIISRQLFLWQVCLQWQLSAQCLR